MVEHFLGKEEVTGSIPVASSLQEHSHDPGRWPCAISSHSNALTAKTAITRPPRTRKSKPAASNTRSTAVIAANIRCTRRPDSPRLRMRAGTIPLQCGIGGGEKRGRYVSSSIGRAAVSKTAGWGFESLLTCKDQLSLVN